MKDRELAECLRRLKMTRMGLAKLLGRDLDTITPEMAATIRGLVLWENIRALVNEVRVRFPDATVNYIRSVDKNERG